ncbi:MAG TPA: M13 family metallopeptidase [Candidatus Saccharimonadales bacterium]|jgi:putative endopeptidase|nr:M13 family metallopeptidase [Candidatus Saccharimonadales bacterium]
MYKNIVKVAAFLFFALNLVAQTGAGPSILPKAPAFSISSIDKSVDPCIDFYQYACGNWIKSNPLPPDYVDWISFNEVQEYNYVVLRSILEKAGANDAKRSANSQKIGDFYASCVDEKAVNKKGYTPLKPELDRIAAITNKIQMIEVAARLSLLGPNPILSFGANPDLHDSSINIAGIDQGGLTLPDRDYYLKDDADMVAIRKAYVDHLKKMFALIGGPSGQASQSAGAVLKIETELARAAVDRTLRRDPKMLDHKMTVAELQKLAPGLHFERFFRATGAPAFKELNVATPDFFKSVGGLIESEPLESWKAYLAWQLLSNSAGLLSGDIVQEDFQFQKALTGQQQLPDRWKRCINSTDMAVGEALGQQYVERTFGDEGKQRMLKMVDALEKALKEDIADLPWMSATTKKEAHIKLAAIRNKIGFPDKFRDYSKLEIVRGDLLGNAQRAAKFESNRILQRIGKPVDRTEWGITPPTVNAFYNGERNEIVFPAGILQPPFFDRSMDDAINLGGIGLVIGHELTHGFDDEGRKFDAQGNLRDWWTTQDAEEFEKRATCVADEYSSFTAIDDLKLNGRLTLGENTADNGGARVALMALHTLMRESKQDSGKLIDGYTPDQRFFLGYGRVWCENTTPENMRLGVRVDPHSPGRWRVNGVVRNMPEFQKAFGCKAGQPMAPANACRVW